METARGYLQRLGQGVGLPLRAMRFLVQTPTAWVYIWAPVLLTLLGLALGFGFGWGLTARLLRWAWAEPAGFWGGALWFTVHLTLFLVSVPLVALTVPQIVCAPLGDLLSAHVEQVVLGGTEGEAGLRRMLRETWHSVWAALSRLLRFALGQALLLLLNLIPGGQAVYPVASFLWSAIWLSQQYLDQTMARHLYSSRQARATLRSVRPLGLAMGSVLAVIFLVPLANLFLVPVGVVSGALLYCDLLQEGKVEGRAPEAAGSTGGGF